MKADFRQAETRARSQGCPIIFEAVKAIPGLREAGRAWNQEIHRTLIGMGFQRAYSESCVYFRKGAQGLDVIILYVDDLIFSGKNPRSTLRELQQHYDITDRGKLKWFLGVKWTWDKGDTGVTLTQTAFIDNMVEKFAEWGVDTADHEKTPMEPGLKLSMRDCPTSGDRTLSVPYAELVCAMLYVSRWTRPDIALPIAILCRFTANPGRRHWRAALHLLRFLNGTKTTGIRYSTHGTQLGLFAFCDAEWASIDVDTRKSFGGFVIYNGGGPISWRVRQQARTAQSSCTAEYYTLADCGQEVKWLRTLMGEVGVEPTSATPVFKDNQAARLIASRKWKEKGVRHLDVRHHMIRDFIEFGDIIVLRCRTTDMVADVLTKPLGRLNFNAAAAKLMGDSRELDEYLTEQFQRQLSNEVRLQGMEPRSVKRRS